MAVVIEGPKLTFGASKDSITINCPIKKIRFAYGSDTNIAIDDKAFSVGRSIQTIEFHSINGYPGVTIAVGTISSATVILIEEIGDVLNPNYFKEDIRNWNGQGAAASVSEASEAPKKATKAKKAEVTE